MAVNTQTKPSSVFSPNEKPLKPYELMTPEGITLRLGVAPVMDRATAFTIDYLLIILATLAVVVPLWLIVGEGFGSTWAGALAILANFLIRHFYFVFFEVRWQGSTPGKRRMGIRVIDRAGGTLRGDAVLVRNLTREIEVFLPLLGIVNPELLWPGAEGLSYLVLIIWLLIFALMPVFNAHRMRIGDMVAGTMVVATPEALLLPDLSTTVSTGKDDRKPTYSFTQRQLDVYGIYELQVLEELLRRNDVDDAVTKAEVTERIKIKIRWDKDRWKVNADTFLRDFYAAQRAHLEHKMLLGKRQEYKRNTDGWRKRKR